MKRLSEVETNADKILFSSFPDLNKEKICIGTMLKEEIVLDVDPDMPLYNLYKESNAQLGFYRQKLHHRREEVRNLHQEVADVCAGKQKHFRTFKNEKKNFQQLWASRQLNAMRKICHRKRK